MINNNQHFTRSLIAIGIGQDLQIICNLFKVLQLSLICLLKKKIDDYLMSISINQGLVLWLIL